MDWTLFFFGHIIIINKLINVFGYGYAIIEHNLLLPYIVS